MNIFEHLISPPSSEFTSVLYFIQIITYLLFIPYTCLLTGGLILSSVYYNKANKKQNSEILKLSRDIINKTIINKTTGFGLGIIPLITTATIFLQFFYTSNTVPASLLIISILLYVTAYILSYSYKSLINIKEIINSLEYTKTHESNIKSEDSYKLRENIEIFKYDISKKISLYGKLAIFFLLLSVFFLFGSVTIYSNPILLQKSDTIFAIFADISVWLKLIYFVILAFSLTSVTLIFQFFTKHFQKNSAINILQFTNGKLKTFLTTAIISTISLPIIVVFNFLILPDSSLIPSVFIFTGISFISTLVTVILLYAIIRTPKLKYSVSALIFIYLIIFSGIMKDELAFKSSIKEQIAVVNLKAEEIYKEKFPKTTSVTEVNGEEIYKSRCAACHKFDVKLVGPPYKETLPKYNNDIKKLSQYIYNPVKVNPEYPPMPNQGLKMNEAEAVAKYIIETYTK